jgi:hypothetical protein
LLLTIGSRKAASIRFPDQKNKQLFSSIMRRDCGFATISLSSVLQHECCSQKSRIESGEPRIQ